MYVSALEQAEQFFRAARTVGPATQLVLVFYGLSQAGRAIAAAAIALPDKSADVEDSVDEWNLKGHGIQSLDEDGPLPDVAMKTDSRKKSGSFVRLSRLLDSPLRGNNPPPLSRLWDCLLCDYEDPIADPNSRIMPLLVEERDLVSNHREKQGAPHAMLWAPVVNFPARVTTAEDPTRVVTDYIAHFPGVRDHHSYHQLSTNGGQTQWPDLRVHAGGQWPELTMNWMLPRGPGTLADRQRYLRSITRLYAGTRYFFPSLGGSVTSVHPLMAWWAVLHTLSTISRYQPAEWGRHIDVHRSQHAVPIERLLTESIRILPQLVAEAIGEVSDSQSRLPQRSAQPEASGAAHDSEFVERGIAALNRSSQPEPCGLRPEVVFRGRLNKEGVGGSLPVSRSAFASTAAGVQDGAYGRRSATAGRSRSGRGRPARGEDAQAVLPHAHGRGRGTGVSGRTPRSPRPASKTHRPGQDGMVKIPKSGKMRGIR
ncbi:YaaC family protein [Streptomyces halstedii]|uniref:Uncharacterized protein n=1 Tax=Streptomyces halstedii TaxID=1944 RepID=A0A6N9UAN5_STRHA|nr:hypothetical protein [Streptomyces halstedii]NEA20567.1 hypothetical protein [Streptomyces halstedii]